MCNEIINATDNVSTNVTNTILKNMANTILANVMSTISINSDDKNVRYKMDCHILHTVLLVVILLFIIAIICYHYRSIQKRIGALTI